MSTLGCFFGIHSWKGCVCRNCNKKRPEGHVWKGCVCGICGEKRDQDHRWEGCTCAECGLVRDQDHDLSNCICNRCGKQIHEWNGCRCTQCGAVDTSATARHEMDGCTCKKCGVILHKWYHCTCSVCGEKRDVHTFVSNGNGALYCKGCGLHGPHLSQKIWEAVAKKIESGMPAATGAFLGACLDTAHATAGWYDKKIRHVQSLSFCRKMGAADGPIFKGGKLDIKLSVGFDDSHDDSSLFALCLQVYVTDASHGICKGKILDGTFMSSYAGGKK